ncbi:MAG: glycoside hydrolase [Candidatus Omnitrophica bacterium]|nr:glycoside hydrolase [Candidatus Omnitrophota bacterium]
METVGRGIAIKGQEGTDYQRCFFPGFCVLPSGRWIVSCRPGYLRNNNFNQRVFASYSDDQGKIWSVPFSPFNSEEVNGELCVFRGAYLTPLEGSKILSSLCWVGFTRPELPLFNEKVE